MKSFWKQRSYTSSNKSRLHIHTPFRKVSKSIVWVVIRNMYNYCYPTANITTGWIRGKEINLWIEIQIFLKSHLYEEHLSLRYCVWFTLCTCVTWFTWSTWVKVNWFLFWDPMGCPNIQPELVFKFDLIGRTSLPALNEKAPPGSAASWILPLIFSKRPLGNITLLISSSP